MRFTDRRFCETCQTWTLHRCEQNGVKLESQRCEVCQHTRPGTAKPKKEHDGKAVVFVRLKPALKERLSKLCKREKAVSLNQFVIKLIEDAITAMENKS